MPTPDILVRRHKNGPLLLGWRNHSCCGETEYGDFCVVTEDEAASLLASKLVIPWFLGAEEEAKLAGGDPSRFVALEVDDGDPPHPLVMVDLPATAPRTKPVRFEVHLDSGSLLADGACVALLARTGIADRRVEGPRGPATHA